MPELGCIVTSLIPALLKVLAMSIDFGPAHYDPSLWKYLSANPSTNCSDADTTATSDFMLSDTHADLLHHGLVFCQAVFSFQLLPSLISRRRLVRFRRRKCRKYRILDQSPCSLGQQTMGRHECSDECLRQVVEQVPTIGNVPPLRASCCSPFS